MSRFVIAVWIVSLTVPTAQATVYFSKADGSDSANCLTWAAACTLTRAMDLAEAAGGGDVWATEGTYIGPVALRNSVRLFGGFAGTETGASQSNPTVRPTIIDGGGARAISNAGGGPSTVLRGFTIRNGMDDSYDGGGGILLENSSALIVQCIFENNKASYFGGAVALRGGSPQFINCIFRNNGPSGSAYPLGGGAVFAQSGSPMFANCLFHHNAADEGGAMLVASATPTFVNCTLADNQAVAAYGGAIADQEGNAFFKNSILWSNTAAKDIGTGAQVFCGSGGRSRAVYSNIQGGWIGSTIINVDPLFSDPATANYSLQQASPCRSVGDNALIPPDAGNLDWDVDTDESIPRDLSMSPRIRNSTVDLGVYEPFYGGGGGGGGG